MGPFLSRRLFLPSLAFEWPVLEYLPKLSFRFEDGLYRWLVFARIYDDGGFALDELLSLLAGLCAVLGRHYHPDDAGVYGPGFRFKFNVGSDGEVHNS